MSRAVRAASAVVAALSAHSLLNLRLLRHPNPGSVDSVTASVTRSTDPGGGGRAVSVLVPARDEAHRVAPCVRALLAQRGVEYEILVLDDGSTDGTADVVRAAAAGGPRLRLLEGAALPDGWLGKPHACAQLAAAARGDVLVFVDADVVVAPDGVAATVALLGDGLDLVSPYPRQAADGAAERLVQPLLQWSWLTFLPLRLAERLPAPSLTAANGQLLACGAAAYRAAGGHAAVRTEVIEDVALARAFKRAGFRVAMADGTAVATCRMYGGWAELRDGYAKSLWAAFGSPAGAVAAVALLAWLYVLPPAAAAVAFARGRPRAAAIGLAGYVAGVAGRAACARRTGGRPLDALAHPVSICALAWLTALSWHRRLTGTAAWRGRRLG